MPVHEIRNVKSSNGTVQKRIFIQTLLQVGEVRYLAEVSLTDRAGMSYPMLVGRRFLDGRFLVDVSLRYQSSSAREE